MEDTTFVSNGNTKLGRVAAFSLSSRTTCPGASAWCKEHCYALRIERFRPHCRRAYSQNFALTHNLDAFVREMLETLPPDTPAMRIHVGGDFYNAPYVNAWKEICLRRPRTLFWAYTRSWTLPRICAALEQLRALPNVELFASTDPTMPLPPPGWRIAFIDEDPRAHGLACPQQTGGIASCLDCGYCFRERQGHVVFKVH